MTLGFESLDSGFDKREWLRHGVNKYAICLSRITINVYISSYSTTEGLELLQLGALCGSQGRLGGFVDGVEIIELGFTEICFNALTTMSEDRFGSEVIFYYFRTGRGKRVEEHLVSGRTCSRMSGVQWQ